MKNHFILLFILVGSFKLTAQTIVNSPTINKYAKVISIDYCENTIDVPTGFGNQFNIGEKVIIIQMKGADLTSGNTANSGTVADYNNAGNYEINEISGINSGTNDILTFKFQIERPYDETGSVQIVSLPEYEDVVFQNTLTCLAWNGEIGGVLAFQASGLVTLNANIDVSEKGFRGGVKEETGSSFCFSGFGYSGYNCSNADECGAPKGEGIGNRYETLELARTPNANGGGGGNDHNSGGGGGSSFVAGGNGGDLSQASCNGMGGFPGESLNYASTPNKIFLSGGGGAGDGGNASGPVNSTSGGNAGAAIFIKANAITSNGNKIVSNGQTVTDIAYYDGAGGGGAGGVVILDIENYNDNLTIETLGGNGGVVEDQSGRCPGPGGGGAGGLVWLSQSTANGNINLLAAGGTPGINTTAPCMGDSLGATSGETGGFVFNFPSYVSDEVFEKLSLSAGTDTVICGEGVAPLFANASASNDFNFQWTWSSGTETAYNFDFNPESPGFYNVIANANYLYNGDYCEEIFIVNVDIRRPQISIVASSFFGDTVNAGEAVFVNAVVVPLNPNYVYEWTPTDRIEPNNDRNAIATAAITEQACLKVTDELGCHNTECVDIYVHEPYIKTPNAFSPNGDDRNDNFIPIISDDLEVEAFRIYSRWGDIVYETTENIAWDGTKKGKELPSDLYFYYFKAKQTLSGTIYEKQGNISIVR